MNMARAPIIKKILTRMAYDIGKMCVIL